MHTTIMTNTLAFALGNDFIKGTSERGCSHCGYNIPNGETVFVESWIPLEDLTSGNTDYHPQWKVYHPLCVAQKALFIVQKQIPHYQTPENDPTLEVAING